MASATMRERRRLAGIASQRCGAISFTDRPLIQRSDQKSVLFPSPTVMSRECVKKSDKGWLGVRVGQPEDGQVFARHSRRNCSVCPRRVQSVPSPPSSRDRCTCVQAIAHLPVTTTSVPDQRKAFMILVSALITHDNSERLRAMCTGMAHRVDLIRVRRTLRCMSCPFQQGSRSATLSTKGCKRLQC